MAFEHGLNARSDAWRWWILAAVLLTLSIDAEYHLHRLPERGQPVGQLRNDQTLLWALPVLVAALFCIRAYRRAWLLLTAVGLYVLVLVSTGYSSDAPILVVLPYLTSFGAFFLIAGGLSFRTADEP